MMEPVLAPMGERLRSIPLTEPKIPYVSNLTGLPVRPGEATDPAFWLRHLRQPVRFAHGAGHLLGERPYAFLELGAGRTLLSQVAQHPALTPEHQLVGVLPRAAGDTPEIEAALGALGTIWAGGADIAGGGLFRGERRRRVSLPTYPFERQRHFLGRPAGMAAAPWTELAARQELLIPSDRATGEVDVAQQENVVSEAQAQQAPEAAGPQTDPRVHAALVGLLKDVVQEITGMPPDRLDSEAAFLEIGVDSLLLIQASQKLRDRLGVRLTVVQLLEELPTLGSVADYLARELPAERLAELMGPAAQVPVTSPTGARSPSPEGREGEGNRERGPGGEGQRPEPIQQVPVTSPPVTSPAFAQVLAQVPVTSPAPLAPISVIAQPVYQAVPAGAGGALTQLFAQQVQVLNQQLQILQGAVPTTFAAAAQAPVTVAMAPTTAPSLSAAATAPVPASYTTLGPFQPLEGRAIDPLPARQQAYLDRFIARYTARTAKSKELTATYRTVLADGRNTIGFRRTWKEIVYPIHGGGSRGSRLRDVDGKH
jgi:acyl transferase domain-containing protein